MNSANLIGTIIAERYELLSIAGSGAMGTVFKAKQIDLGRIVAVKLLDPQLVSDDENAARFQLEGKSLARLSHNHIGSFYNFGILKTGQPYIVMEYIEGPNLKSIILRNGSLEIEQILHIARQVSSAMQHAHELGIVHRDLKPENIVLQQTPEPDYVKVVDFGLAKDTAQAHTLGLTATGELIGTPLYLSPEQCRGQRADSRSDIYSLGCILFEMLTGRPPFEAETAIGILGKHLNQEIVIPKSSTLDRRSAALGQIILKAMVKDPQTRYQDMASLDSDLAYLKANQFDSLSTDLPILHKSSNKSNKVAMTVLAIVSIGLIAAASVYYKSTTLKNAEPETVEKLVEAIKNAPAGKQSKEQDLLKRLEKLVKQNETDQLKRAKTFLSLAKQFSGLKNAECRMALLSTTEAASYSISTNKNRTMILSDSAAMGGGMKTSARSVAELKSQHLALGDAGDTMDEAAGILLEQNYQADKKTMALWVKACKTLRDHFLNYGKTNFYGIVLDNLNATNMHMDDFPLVWQSGLIAETSNNDFKRLWAHLRKGESLWKNSIEDRYQVIEGYLDAARHCQDQASIAALIERSQELMQSFDPRDVSKRLLQKTAEAYYIAGKVELAKKFASKVVNDSHSEPDRAAEGQCYVLLSRIFSTEGRCKEAILMAEKALDPPPDKIATRTDAAQAKMHALIKSGLRKEALSFQASQLDMIRALADKELYVAIYLESTAPELNKADDRRAAANAFAEAARIYREFGFIAQAESCLANFRKLESKRRRN